jgi:hypothetical protein
MKPTITNADRDAAECIHLPIAAPWDREQTVQRIATAIATAREQGRVAGLEEAAKICQMVADEITPDTLVRHVAVQCQRRIRALLPAEPSDQAGTKEKP